MSVVVLAVLLVASNASALAVYDDFEASRINLTRWVGVETGTLSALGFTDLEFIRRQAGGRLQLALRSVGPTGASGGGNALSAQGLRIAHPALTDDSPKITVLQVAVTMREALAQACEGSIAAVAATVFGAFFHDDGTAVIPGQHDNDVVVAVQLFRSSDGADRLTASLGRCVDAKCFAWDTIRFVSFARSWALDVPELVRIQWQRDRDRFVVIADNGASREAHVLDYAGMVPGDGSSPGRFGKGVHVETHTPVCPSVRSRTSIDARFDDVMLNDSAAEALP